MCPAESSLPQATKQQLHAGRQGSHAGRPNTPDLTWRSCIQQWQKEAECVHSSRHCVRCHYSLY